MAHFPTDLIGNQARGDIARVPELPGEAMVSIRSSRCASLSAGLAPSPWVMGPPVAHGRHPRAATPGPHTPAMRCSIGSIPVATSAPLQMAPLPPNTRLLSA
ncbi:MAG: hypothetical protein KGL51_01535 [Betaproteobacteria bacterium]|nr:hypothetical protein [Betaproteobacteria bacterium]MDE2124274.1 hypothetical protein [Betaproteobacteria bacterium]MDE2323343.1 hypothetical protein [Betaproteobacteria bacterium]